jgi:hypothetical protein
MGGISCAVTCTATANTTDTDATRIGLLLNRQRLDHRPTPATAPPASTSGAPN